MSVPSSPPWPLSPWCGLSAPWMGPTVGTSPAGPAATAQRALSLLVTLPKVSLYSVQLSVVAAFTRRRPIYRGYYCCFHSLIGIGAVVRPRVVYRVVKED